VEGEILYLIFLQIYKRDKRRKCQQTIGDRQFVSFVQFFLHKCGEITLGRLRICPTEDGNEPIVCVNEEDEGPYLVNMPMPIPENIKGFESIRLRFIFYTKVYIN
jgi:hypothetical protein